ncbi:MAG: hypothetical protein QM751_11265 [Paludibacteraceae bacterium]
MRKFNLFFVILLFCVITPLQAQIVVGGTENEVSSPTENIINTSFVDETAMKDELLQMLANFMVYVKNDFQDAVNPNSANEACACFQRRKYNG